MAHNDEPRDTNRYILCTVDGVPPGPEHAKLILARGIDPRKLKAKGLTEVDRGSKSELNAQLKVLLTEAE